MIKVLLVDDHQIVVDGFASLLEGEEGIEVIDKVLNGPDALESMAKSLPDVLVVDLELEDGFDGMQLIEKTREQYPTVKTLVLSMYKTDAHITGVLAAGASGYIVKNRGIEELVGALKDVYSGKNYYSNEVTDAIMESHRKPTASERPKEPNVKLTKREKEVLRLLAEGFTGPEVADKLFIAQSTVETHRRNVIEKANIKSKELVVFAIRSGILDED